MKLYYETLATILENGELTENLKSYGLKLRYYVVDTQPTKVHTLLIRDSVAWKTMIINTVMHECEPLYIFLSEQLIDFNEDMTSFLESHNEKAGFTEEIITYIAKALINYIEKSPVGRKE